MKLGTGMNRTSRRVRGQGIGAPEEKVGMFHSHSSYTVSTWLDFQMLLSPWEMLPSEGVTCKSLLPDPSERQEAKGNGTQGCSALTCQVV